MIREGRICGIGFFEIYDWTWGEVMEFVSCRYEADRRAAQTASLIAYKEAEWINRILAGKGKKIDLMKELPFWTQEEKNEARVARLKERLMRYTKNGS